MASIKPVPNESKIPVGAMLAGKYKVTREIGRGGMACVYEAEQMALGKRVALKVLAQELTHSNIVIERFFREARAAASVQSPYIVDVYDSGRLEDGRPFIAMEFLDGESLYDRMARIRLIDPTTTVRIISHCAKGLMKAHAAGIVHRDLKPENIFIVKSEDGEEISKLLDFGLAKFYAPVKTDEKTARLTREGAVFGTPAYMSPEQVKGQGNVDQRADLWALGCMAYECLIGRPVWNTDQGVAMTFAAIATQPIPVPSKIRSDLPLAFDEWFKHALERDPAKRFQSAKELADALKEALLGPAAGPVSYVNISSLDSIEAADDATQKLSNPIFPNLTPTSGDPVAEAVVPLPPPPRPPNASATEMPPTASTPFKRASSTSVFRWVLSAALLVTGAGAIGWVWIKQLKVQVLTPLVVSTATTVTTSDSANVTPTGPAIDEPKWGSLIADGQQLFASGDFASAQKKFKDAEAAGGASVARAYLDQTKVASSSTGPCKMTAFVRPRYDTKSNAARPAVVQALHAPVMVWTDDHEQKDHDHVYSVELDEFGRATSAPRDVTPEASDAQKPSLITAGDRLAMLYWDRGGSEAGVRARWLDSHGRIAGASSAVGALRSGHFWPSFEKSPEGFVVVWQDDRDHENTDLFFRKLSGELEPRGPEVRLTDYAAPLPSKAPQVRVPTVAVASNAMLIAYKLERDTQHTIERLRVALDDVALQKGLDEQPPTAGKIKKDRMLGDVKTINDDKLPADAPIIACGSEGCFIAWHSEQGGSNVALVEPAQGKVIWRKKVSQTGGHPALGVGEGGQMMIAWFEKGFVRIATVTRDGVGKESAFAHVSGEPPRPWIAAGKNKNEWLVAWEDFDGSRSEVEAAKVVCSP